MTKEEALRKLEFMRNAYQKLIDENVDEGRFVGTDVTGTWKADVTLNEVYREHVEALDMAITAMKKQEEENWIPVAEKLPEDDCECRVSVKGLYTADDYVSTCYWNKYKKRFEEWNEYSDCMILVPNVIAWKPIEDPYVEGK